MLNRIKTVEDVAAWRLCCGCGACAGLYPEKIEMHDVCASGRRPRFISAMPDRSGLDICPGIELNKVDMPQGQLGGKRFFDLWGPVLGVWEGYASDVAIRYEGSSGGAATALALFGMEKLGASGTVHTCARQDIPYLNQTVFSTSRQQLLAGSGSRYAPASPAEGLRQIKSAEGKSIFIGKPCDVAAAAKAAALVPILKEKVAFSIAFFCAGTPSTAGTLEMLRRVGLDTPEELISLRYRGCGWPGNTTIEYRDKNGKKFRKELTYEQSWGDILQKYRQWRCYICPDHIGEYADIAVADAWHRPVQDNQPGISIIIARTERGLEIIRKAQQAGYLTLSTASPQILQQCMPWQVSLRSQLWGRLLALRSMGIPSPRFMKFNLFGLWRSCIARRQQVKSWFSTYIRIVRKNLYRRADAIEL